jgi:general secretion pathway protein A
LLSNLETEKEKLLQIVLVGQPELAEMLDRESLRQLKQRISLRYHVASLEPAEISEYIEHRLRVAGGDGRIRWAPEALTFIYSYSRGIPRLINVLCDKALLSGYIAETFVIDATNIRRAIEDTECRLPASAAEQTSEVVAG